jgi:hypothetical protein
LVHFLSTPTIVATVVAALASVIAVLVLQVAEAAKAAVVGGGGVAFLLVLVGLMSMQRQAMDPLRNTTPKFPTPDSDASSTPPP